MTEDLKNLLSITKLFQHAKLYLAPAGKSGSFVMGANFFFKSIVQIPNQWSNMNNSGTFSYIDMPSLGSDWKLPRIPKLDPNSGRLFVEVFAKLCRSYSVRETNFLGLITAGWYRNSIKWWNDNEKENYFTFDQSIECSQPALALVDLLDRDILKIARAKVTIFFCEFWYQIC